MTRFAFQNVLVVDLGWHNLFSRWSIDKALAPFSVAEFWNAFWLTMRLSLATSFLTVALIVPTTIWVHLRLPHLRAIVEFLSLLPYVIPAIGLVAGIVVLKPSIRWFISSDYALVPFYMVISLPFTYRAIDNALRSIDLDTLSNASRNLGGSWLTTIARVIIPNIKTAISSAVFLTVAVVMGEYTISNVLLKQTLPTFTVVYRGTDPRAGYALSMLTLAFTVTLFTCLDRISRIKRDKKVTTIG